MATLHSCQEAYESVPVEWDDDSLDFDGAELQATEELEATPASFVQWLDAHCQESWEPLEAYKLGRECVTDLTVPQLVAMLIACPNAEAENARHELRWRYLCAHQSTILERANEIMKEQA